jgi:acyl-CoA thioesterase-1
MRPVVLGCAFVVVVFGGGCSRNPPSPTPAAAPPALIDRPTLLPPTQEIASLRASHSRSLGTLQLATKLEGESGGGAVSDEKPAAPSLAGKTVLLVGDSMVGGNFGLSKALDQRFTAEGAKFIRDYKVSESIVSYDHSPKLKELLAKHKPDILILTLGTNDVFVPFPAAMAGNIQSIVKRIGPRECYWMGPPTWKPDTGIVQVIKDNAAPCKFFDSSNLKLQRAGDGIHPTDRGGADWAASFWTFFRPTAPPAAQ